MWKITVEGRVRGHGDIDRGKKKVRFGHLATTVMP